MKHDSSQRGFASFLPRMTQPEEMKTARYLYGVEPVDGNDAWALFVACAAGNRSQVTSLLHKDRRLANAQYWYQFPIHMAVRAGNAEIVQLLLDAGADPGQSRFTYNSWDKLLQTAQDREYRAVELALVRAMKKRFNYNPEFQLLKDAILSRDQRRLAAVVRRRPDLIRAGDALGNNALHWSVLSRQLRLIPRFVELGVPLEARRADGQTPLLLAVNGATDYWYRATRGRAHPSLRNHWVLVGCLLSAGAAYPISVAAAIGDCEQVEALLRKDSTLALRLDPARISPLTYAAREGHLHIVRLLLERGADPNLPEDLAPNGRALFEACAENHLDVAQLLLKHGADPNAGVDSCGCCLTIAEAYHGQQARPMQLLLRKHGAQQPPYCMTAREMRQAIRKRLPVVGHDEFPANVLRKSDPKLLELYLDSDPKAIDRLDHDSIISRAKPLPLVQALLARGLDPNRTDWLGTTLLHAAADRGLLTVASALLDAGADPNARELEFFCTPLAAAVRACGNSDTRRANRARRMVKFLLERGAAPNLPDDPTWAIRGGLGRAKEG